MARPSWTDLPAARRPYRLDCNTRAEDGVVRFRTREEERNEDRQRCRSLGNISSPTKRQARHAADLKRRLEEGLKRGEPAQTLASAEWHRQLRMPILSALWRLVEQPDYGPFAFVTLRPRGTLIEGDQLDGVKPNLLLKRLRNDFDRVGVTAAPGFAFFGLDAEFDANRGRCGVWDFHYHGIVAGDKLGAVEGLREKRKYQPGRVDPLEAGLKEGPRVKVQEGLFNLPSPLTYCLESWVPHRPTTLQPDGTRIRSKRKFRIPNPYSNRWLMWMDGRSIEDFIMSTGLTISKEGLTVRPKE